MNRTDIENMAQAFEYGERWLKLIECGAHDWQSLPVTDAGEHYCLSCYTLWSSDGHMLNIPTAKRCGITDQKKSGATPEASDPN